MSIQDGSCYPCLTDQKLEARRRMGISSRQPSWLVSEQSEELDPMTMYGTLWTKPFFPPTSQDTHPYTREKASKDKKKKNCISLFPVSIKSNWHPSRYVIQTWVQVLACQLLCSMVTLNFRFLICKLVIIPTMAPSTLFWEFRQGVSQEDFLEGVAPRTAALKGSQQPAVCKTSSSL